MSKQCHVLPIAHLYLATAQAQQRRCCPCVHDAQIRTAPPAGGPGTQGGPGCAGHADTHRRCSCAQRPRKLAAGAVPHPRSWQVCSRRHVYTCRCRNMLAADQHVLCLLPGEFADTFRRSSSYIESVRICMHACMCGGGQHLVVKSPPVLQLWQLKADTCSLVAVLCMRFLQPAEQPVKLLLHCS
jgi:hypothetical protein